MKNGDVVLIRLRQTGAGFPKLRPAMILSLLPGPYQNILIAGISTQLHSVVPNWDELISRNDPDFALSGLHYESVIRLSYLYAADASEILGTIGRIEPVRLQRLRLQLAQHLQT